MSEQWSPCPTDRGWKTTTYIGSLAGETGSLPGGLTGGGARPWLAQPRRRSAPEDPESQEPQEPQEPKNDDAPVTLVK